MYHSCARTYTQAVGAIIGFSLAYKGGSSVLWAQPDPSAFPPYKGVVPIILTWVFSPLFTGTAAAAIFLLCRWAVLRRSAAYVISFWLLPPLVTITVFVSIFFV